MWDRNQSDDDRAYSQEYVAWAESKVRPTIESVRDACDFVDFLQTVPEPAREGLICLRSKLLELEEEGKWWQDAYDERF
jgi:hypothetical protein